MTKLAQVLAVEKDAKSHSNDAITETYQIVQKGDLFAGISRTYEPKDDEGDQLPPESTKVQLRVEEMLQALSVSWSKLLNVTATKDWANTEARADVVVNGETILSSVPTTFLVWLEKQLIDMRTVITKLPVLDPAFDWENNEAAAAWATPATKATRTRKVRRSHVLYDATAEHPAQVESYTEDEVAGYWTTIRFSGAIPKARQDELLSRVEVLQEAVKLAREQANTTEAPNINVGEALFGYLLA